MQESRPVAEPIPATVLALARACETGRVTVCAGAGLSRADDAGLPLGAELASMLDTRLTARLSGYVSPSDSDDLIAVADAAIGAAESLKPLQLEVRDLGNFLRTGLNLGHRALALLMAEGAVSGTLLWNWDNCLERAAPEGERLEAAMSAADVADLDIPAVLKVHGCATRVTSLMITSDQLADPAPWVANVFEERLASGVVVFVGIGDVADYARHRLKDLVARLDTGVSVVVVGPSIVSSWSTSQWARVAPTLESIADARIELDADTFLDSLLRLWAGRLLLALHPLVSGGVEGAPAAAAAVSSATSLGLVSWTRAACASPAVGSATVVDRGTVTAVLALGLLATRDGAAAMHLMPHARARWGSRVVVTHVVDGLPTAPVVRAEIDRRVQRLAEMGVADKVAEVLVAGQVIGRPDSGYDCPVADIFDAEPDPDDILRGPLSVNVTVLLAAELVGSI